MDLEFSTYYKSLTSGHRIDEAHIVEKSLAAGVLPVDLRYGIMKGVYRGIIKSSNDMLYYFHYSQDNDSFRLVKADDPTKIYEANKLLKSCQLGCSIIKAGEGNTQSSGGVNTVDEETNIDQQDALMTDVHPGAATTTTPDRVDRGRMWHEQESPVMAKSWDAGTLLSSLNDTLKKSTDNLRRPVSDKEAEFMVEVMGKTPEQISRGDTYMGPAHKVQFQQWLGKSMKSKVNVLDKWAKK